MKNMTFTPSVIKGTVRVPSSKSQSHRALICAALAGNSIVRGVDISNDITATANALSALGAKLIYNSAEHTFYIDAPCARNISAGTVNSGESASTLRFFIPLAAALGADVTFTGEGRLPKRPTDIYVPILTPNGVSLEYPKNSDFLPLHVSGQLTSGEFSLRGDVSSQFVTGLIYAATQLCGESKILLTTNLESKPYVDLTVDMLKEFGADITEIDSGYAVKGTELVPREIYVEGDCSQAAFFAVAAAIGGSVTLGGVRRDTKQGDFRLFDIVSRFGAEVKWDGENVTVCKTDTLRASDIDAANIPDLVPALAVMAAFAEGTTRIYNAGRLRIKESDRIASTVQMLTSLGAIASETEDGLIIVGQKQLAGGKVCAYNDHRIAMAAAAASAGCSSDVTVDDMSCINKSYPEFVRDFMSISIPR